MFSAEYDRTVSLCVKDRYSDMNLDGNPCFEVFIGYNDVVGFRKDISSYIQECGGRNVFLNAKLGAADYEATKLILSIIQEDGKNCLINRMTAMLTVNKLMGKLSNAARAAIAEAVATEFSVLSEKSRAGFCSDTILRNAFVRVMFTLKSAFYGLLENTGDRMFFEGNLSKYDFITLNVLFLLGVRGKAVCYNHNGTDFLTKPRFTVKIGNLRERIDFAHVAASVGDAVTTVVRNDGFEFPHEADIGESLDSLIRFIDGRKADFAGGVSAALSVCVRGVGDINKYKLSVNKFYMALKSKREVFVIDAGFGNPTYEESQSFSANGFSQMTIDTLLNRYEALRDTPFPEQVKNAADRALVGNARKSNAETVFKIWFLRICDVFNDAGKGFPAIIIWGAISGRVLDFISCLEYLPVDIVQFSPAGQPDFSLSVKSMDAGSANCGKLDFPYEAKKLSGHQTVAFRAEQEIREVLSGDDTLYYQRNQFSEMNPIILKTTFEEIDILWREPAKFRPSFSTVGGVVTIPSIFAKVSGVSDSLDDYILGIRAKITPETLLISKFPYLSPEINRSAADFMKRVYVGKEIDAEKVKSCEFYNYRLFSQETQNIIIKGIRDFVNNDWYVKKRSSFVYDVLEILFRLPNDVVQLIHSFSFTESIPKVVVFNATDKPCGAADCIMILFLKSLGFDVIMYVPTGYQAVEEYIRENLFQKINIGKYRYDLADVDITDKLAGKKGIIKNLFRRKGIQQ